MPQPHVAIIGGGPAGLAAAEALLLSPDPPAVTLFEGQPSLGRKFLMAGKSGLNLTHAEPLDQVLARFGEATAWLDPWLRADGPQAIRDWAAGLGVDTFVGSSGRVFPREMKAAPLLRAWIRRLKGAGLVVRVRHRWTGWDMAGARLCFDSPQGTITEAPDATILALGGASWARLGSDGAWVPWLAGQGVAIAPFRPANCGFDAAWSDTMRTRFAGVPVKSVALRFGDAQAQGDFVVTEHGVEGSAIYALSAALRDACAAQGSGGAVLHIDLAPGRSRARLESDLAGSRGGRTMTAHLERRAGLSPVKIALLREVLGVALPDDPARLSVAIKDLALPLLGPRPIDEAISCAGGIAHAALDDRLMLRARPGVFACGEMLDWEAPTGGYLLTACLATGWAVGRSVRAWLDSPNR